MSAIFQEGVDLVFYNKIKEQRACIDRYDESDVCHKYEVGIYNLNTGKYVLIENYPYLSDYDDYDKKVEVSHFSYFDKSGKKVSAVFSPQGKYLVQVLPIYEGCGIEFVDTTSGKVLRSETIENDYRYGIFDFSCDPLIDFSEDEKTFAVRALHFGMQSPGTQFSVIQGNKKWEILKKLIPEEFNYGWQEIDLFNNFKVTSINNNKIKFDITKDSSLYKKGSYIFNLSEEKLTKQ